MKDISQIERDCKDLRQGYVRLSIFIALTIAFFYASFFFGYKHTATFDPFWLFPTMVLCITGTFLSFTLAIVQFFVIGTLKEW